MNGLRAAGICKQEQVAGGITPVVELHPAVGSFFFFSLPPYFQRIFLGGQGGRRGGRGGRGG